MPCACSAARIFSYRAANAPWGWRVCWDCWRRRLLRSVAGVPTYLLGHTIGPLRGRSARRLAALVLRRATLITVRERHSAALLAELGVSRTKYRLAPDLAFGLTASTAESDAVLERHGLKGVRFLALSVRQHPLRWHRCHQPPDSRGPGVCSASARGAVGRPDCRRRAVPRAHTCRGRPRHQSAAGSRDRRRCDFRGGGFVADGARRRLRGCGRRSRCSPARRDSVDGRWCASRAISYFTSKTEGVFEFMGMPDMWCEFSDGTASMLQNRLRVVLEPAYGAIVSSRAAEARREMLRSSTTFRDAASCT